jgi:hypothetical protein
MKIIKILFFYIVFISLNSCNESNAVKNKKEQFETNNFDYSLYNSEKFKFIISDGANNFFNSETNILSRKYIDSTMNIKIELTQKENETIFKLCKELNVRSFPKNIINLSDYIIIPSFDLYLRFCFEDNCNEAELNDELLDQKTLSLNPKQVKENANKFLIIYNKIWEIIGSKNDFKNLPESDVFYM